MTMKDYFKFTLKGEKLLPIWLLYLVFAVFPTIYVQVLSRSMNQQPHQAGEVIQKLGSQFQIFGWILIIMIVRYAISFFIAKMSIEHFEYKNTTFSFIGKFGDFMGLLLLNLLFTIISFGIYSPWMIKNIMNFFADNSSHQNDAPEFKGKGGKLFLIITFTLMIPVVILSICFGVFIAMATKQASDIEMKTAIYTSIFVVLISMMMLTYIYYVYKWFANFNFKGYSIQWETSFWDSVGKIALEAIFSVITLGIYTPLACVKLYQYFTERTIARSDLKCKKLGYDIEPLEDFLFIWGQLLLSIITLGVYYSWAFCKVNERIIGKTYVEEMIIEVN